jgi:hypothetical protein
MSEDGSGPDLSIFSFADDDDDEIEGGVQKLSISDKKADKKKAGKEGKASQEKVPEKAQSKQAKRRQKKEEEDRERERRIAEHHAGKGPTERDIEIEKISAQLSPQGLRIHEIASDGNCLYRAVAHQLGHGSQAYPSCRREAAQHIRAHPNDFLPYISAEGGELGAYCDTVESSDEWGGAPSHAGSRAVPCSTATPALNLTLTLALIQPRSPTYARWPAGQLEITALAHARKRCIAVYR